MVSNARLDFPDPLTPVTTMSALRGSSSEIFLRLLTRAPRTIRDSSLDVRAAFAAGPEAPGALRDDDLCDAIVGVQNTRALMSASPGPGDCVASCAIRLQPWISRR